MQERTATRVHLVYDRRNSEFSDRSERLSRRPPRSQPQPGQSSSKKTCLGTGHEQSGTKRSWQASKPASVREATADDVFEASGQWGPQLSYGEQIALRGHADLKEVALAAEADVRSSAEDQFLERLRRGEAAAFEQLVAEHTSDVYALLYRLTADPEEARDLTQETFLRAFQSIGGFRGDANLKTWIYRIALNQARNRWRWWKRRKREVTVSLDATDERHEQPLAAMLRNEDAVDPEQETLARERERQLRQALLELRQSYREAVILRDIEGFSYEEVAETLQISIGTVKSRISRGRLELRNKLQGSL